MEQPLLTIGQDAAVTELVVADLRAIATYGQPVHTFDSPGPHNMQDIYEEVLGLAQYLKREIIERGRMETRIKELEALVTRLRADPMADPIVPSS